MTLTTPRKVASHLDEITSAQLARCLRCVEDNGEVWYQVTSESKAGTYYEVRYSADFSFTCTCPSGQHAFGNVKHPSGVCKHIRWALAASMEYKRLLKVDPATIEITDYRPEAIIEYLCCNDGHMAFYYPRLRTYGCACRVANIHQNSERPVCPHIQAAQKYRAMLHQELAEYEREIHR